MPESAADEPLKSIANLPGSDAKAEPGADPMPGSASPRHGDIATSRRSVRPPVTDSPWFWICTFATAALLGLTAAQPKYGKRQAQIEKQYQGREFSVRGRPGAESPVPYSTPEETLVGLGPLFWVFGIAVAVGWAAFWRQRFRSPLPDPSAQGAPNDVAL